MKIVILGAEARYRAYQPAMPFIQQQELVFLDPCLGRLLKELGEESYRQADQLMALLERAL